MRGRKPKWESRALEFYGRLARWKQSPESSRPSLRALARELGTSHQLLSHYLKRCPKRILEKLSGSKRSRNNLPGLGSRFAKSLGSRGRGIGNSSKMLPPARLAKAEGISER